MIIQYEHFYQTTYQRKKISVIMILTKKEHLTLYAWGALIVQIADANNIEVMAFSSHCFPQVADKNVCNL